MPSGTRTAPAINGTPVYRRLSTRLQDVSGDIRSVSLDIPVAVTNAQMEAYVAALQATTQASIFSVEVSDVYASVGDASNAVVGQRNSVYDNVALLLKTPANLSKNGFIPAPAPEVMLVDSDQIDPTSTELIAFFTAILAVAPTYSVVSARYTERREINQAVKI